MMESALYDEFPLFEGDFLLDGFSLTPELPSGPEKDVKLGALQAPLSPEGDIKPAQLFQNLTEQHAPATQETEQPFQSEWLDTKLDLLEFLGTDQKIEVAPEEPSDAISLLDSLGQQPIVVEQLKADNQTLMEALTSLTEALDVPAVEITPAVKDIDCDIGQPLSPVSVDDIESLLSESGPSTSALSTAPSSPQHSEHDDTFNSILFDLMSEGQTESAAGPAKKSKGRKKAPYGSAKKDYDRNLNRKERKKQQNKDAALRYRSKKRGEQDILNEQAAKLEERNKELKEKVDSISREIQYLKDLMSEVRKAKSQ